MSTEVRASNFETKYCDQQISKGYAKAASSMVPNCSLNMFSLSEINMFLLFSYQAPCLHTHDDEGPATNDEDVWKELTLGGSVAITCAFGQDGLGDFAGAIKRMIHSEYLLALMATKSEYGKVDMLSSGDETLSDYEYEKFQKRKGLQSSTSTSDLITYFKDCNLMKEISNKPKLINLREHRGQGKQDQFGTTSKGYARLGSTSSTSRSTDGSYYPRMDNRRPRISSYSPSSSTVGSQAVLPQTVKKNAMINPKQTWRSKGNYLDSVNRDNGSYHTSNLSMHSMKKISRDYAIIDSDAWKYDRRKDKLSDFKEFKGGLWAFGKDSKGGRISGKKETIKTSCLDLKKVSLWRSSKDWGMSISRTSTSWLKAIWLGVYLQRHSSLITHVWHVERVNSTGHLARRLKKRTGHENLSELLHMDSIGPKERIGILIEAARNHVADSLLPIQFWAGSSQYGLLWLIRGVYNSNGNKKSSGMYSCRFLENQENQKGKGQEEGVDYDEVFAPVARIEAIRLFLHLHLSWAFILSDGCQEWHSYMATSREVYVKQPTGFERSAIPKQRSTEVVKGTLWMQQAPAGWRMSSILDEGTGILACKNKTLVAISLQTQNYVAAASCCARIRHHVIRDCYDAIKAINVVKFHTDDNCSRFYSPKALTGNDLTLVGTGLVRLDFLENLATLREDIPQWKLLDHVLLHCISPKGTSWEQFGTNIASALVGLATNQKFNFSLMIMNGMLGHLSNVTALAGRKNIVLVLILGLQVLQGMSRPPQLQLKMCAHSHRTASVQRFMLTSMVRLLHMILMQFNVLILKGTAAFQVVRSHAFWVENQNLKKQKRRNERCISMKSVFSQIGRNKDNRNFCLKSHNVQEEIQFTYPFFDDIVDKDVLLLLFWKTKVNETEEVNIVEKEASNVKIGERNRRLDLETPKIQFKFMESEEQLKAAESTCCYFLPIGLSIPVPIQTQPQQPNSRALELQIRRMVYKEKQAELGCRRRGKGKRFEELKKTKQRTTLRKTYSLAQERKSND
ncbi:ribonuclease H-like domain-containing protein [Tanacetum coccineum]